MAEQYLATLTADYGKPEARDVMNCLAIGVSGAAIELTPQTIKAAVEENPLLSPYLEEIMKLDGINALPPQEVATCIREEVMKEEVLNRRMRSLMLPKRLVHSSQKPATLLIAPLVIAKELEKQIDQPACGKCS